MTVREQLNSIAEKRILIIDGAMGSSIQALNLCEDDFRGSRFADHPTPLKGCNDLLCLTKPDAIAAIHDSYLEAGSDIISTSSFNSTAVSLADYGLGHLAYEISAAAAKTAKSRACKFSSNDKPRFVAGSIGPGAKSASLYPDINDPSKRSICWDELEAAYYDNARGLLDGGADILLVETIFDTLNAKAALFAISRLLEERNIDVPVMVSAAVSGEAAAGTNGGRLLSGQSLEAFFVSIFRGAAPWAIGLNCSLNAEKLLPFARMVSDTVPCFVFAQPNAGLPNKSGKYEETPQIMSANIEEYFKEGLVNLIGGCCGSAGEHIAEIAKKSAAYKPRAVPEDSRLGVFSGLEPLHLEADIIHVSDTADAALKEEFLQLLNEGEYEDAVDAARDMVDEGAAVISIETDNEKTLSGFLDFALMNPYAAKVPFLINSSCFDVLQSGLKRLQGRCLAGPVNLKDGGEEFVRKVKLIGRYGAAAFVTLIDERGQTEDSAEDTFERKTEIARRIYDLARKNGCPIANIAFSIEDNALCSWIQNNCPGVVIAL